MKNLTQKKHRGRKTGTYLAITGLLLCAGCPSTAVVIGLAGYFLGVLSVEFQPDNGSELRVSDTTGQARVQFGSDRCRPRVESYEGILPGFVESGATQVRIDLERGTVSGTVTTPEGNHEDLIGVLPGLSARRSQSDMGFELGFEDGNVRYKYEVAFAMEGDGCNAATELDVEVVIHRQLTDGDEVLLDDSGSGTFHGEQQDSQSRPVPLEPPPPPLIIDAGPDQTITRGDSTVIEATVRSSAMDWSVRWEPSRGLDDVAALQPTAAPQDTTTYTLTVADASGQSVVDVVTITVVEPQFDPLVVDAGPDVSVALGEATALRPRVSGGDGDYTITWSPVSGLVAPNTLAPSASPETTTTYTLTVRDGRGETATDSVTITVTQPADAIGTIRGTVTDTASGAPLPGATVRLDLSPGNPISATTLADGKYVLFAPDVPDFFALSASLAGYIPETANVETATLVGTTLIVDFQLERERLDVIVIEIVPDVHHLGDDNFSGAINSQFQKTSEGVSFTRDFVLSTDQLPPAFNTAQIQLLVKGAQCPNELSMNQAMLDRRLDTAPGDGSFGLFTVSIDTTQLRLGNNSLTVTSRPCDQFAGDDADDFEFVNVQIRLGN